MEKTAVGLDRQIARYCALHMPAPWTPAPLSEHQLTALVKHLGNLEKLKQMQENRQLVAEAYWRMSVICQNSVIARNWWLTQGLIQNGSCSPQESVIYACPDSNTIL
ncbi:MAG: hypothetical protein AB2989_06905 [Candidatus Symbiodolus clandestinus]